MSVLEKPPLSVTADARQLRQFYAQLLDEQNRQDREKAALASRERAVRVRENAADEDDVRRHRAWWTFHITVWPVILLAVALLLMAIHTGNRTLPEPMSAAELRAYGERR